MRAEHKLAQILTQNKASLSIAESCSGGLLAHCITNVPGSSLYFKGGVVAYDNQVKIKILGVAASVLKQHGAVSAPVAQAMAENVRTIFRTDFGVGITGIAGPSGGTREKPVGLTYIAVAGARKTTCKKYCFKGTRLRIKMAAATAALKLLLSIL